MRPDRRLIVLGALAWLASPAAAQHAQQPAAPDRQQRLTSAETYLPLPTLSAGVLRRTGSAGAIVVDMGLDIPDAELRRRAAANIPRLRDSLRTALATYATTFHRQGAAPDPASMVRLMQQAVDHTLGAAGARVLLTNIFYQR